MPDMPIVNCLKCKHYFITWDKEFPKGCKVFKFKTKALPSQTVYEATGAGCDQFCEKK